MKATRILITVAGVVGLLAIFALPYVSVEGMSMKYWDIHEMPKGLTQGLLNGPGQVYVAIVCFLVPALMGLLALATKQLQRWQAIVSAVFFLAALAPEGVRKGLLGEGGVSTAIGGKLLFLAAVAGLVFAVMGITKPERAR